MRPWLRFRSWLAPTFRRSRLENEMEVELHSHLEMHAEALVKSGILREEALRRARLEFGGIERAKEECREARGVGLVDSLLQDLRYAGRLMRNNPGFTIVAVLTLALGIGATTAIFTIVNAIIFRPLPYKDSPRLVTFSTKTSMFPSITLNLTWPAFQEIREHAEIDEVVASWTTDKALTGTNQAVIASASAVSQGFFDALGTRAAIGRLLSAADQQAGQQPVAVISHALWRSRFANDPAVIGRQLILDKQPFTIVGVAGANFSFPEGADVWHPMSLTPSVQRNPAFFAFQVLGRLRRGQHVEALNTQLAAVASRLEQQLAKEKPDLAGSYSIVAENFLDNRVSEARNSYLTLLAAASLVLMIACANLTSLLLARGWRRNREMAMRTALGASPGRLQWQCLVESCLLALLGGVAGIGLAFGGVWLFHLIAPADTARLNEVGPDWTILWFALACSLVSGIVSGLAPARRAARVAPNELLKEGSGAKRRSSFGNGLVVMEVALAFVLLVGATLLIQTLAHLLHQSPGYRTDHLLTLDLPQPPNLDEKKSEIRTVTQVARIKEILRLVKTLPGVDDAIASDHGVLNGALFLNAGIKLEGAVDDRKGISEGVTGRYLSPGYFHTLGIPLVRGREFTEDDALGKRQVVILNEAMARQYWGTVDVLGKRISVSQDGQGHPVWSEVVGIVANVRTLEIHDEPQSEYFMPLFQSGVASHHLVVRTSVNPEVVADTVSRKIWAGFPDQPITNVSTLSQTIYRSVGDQRMHSVLIGIFAALGLILAVLGVYGVVSYSVSRRTQEIGVRAALGASRADVLKMILRQGLTLVGVGSLVGAAGAVAAVRVIASELYGVKPGDPRTFVAALALMMAAGSLGCWVPARRAMLVDPVVALRYE